MAPDVQPSFIALLHISACVVLVAALLAPILRSLKRHSSRAIDWWLLIAAGLLLVCTQALTTLVWNTGYADPFLFLLALGAYELANRRVWILAGALALAGPFVHEAFVFIWCCPAVLLLMRARRRQKSHATVVVALIPVVATCGVLLAHSAVAASAMIDAAPLNAVTKAGLRQYQYGLSSSDAFAIMVRHFGEWPGHFALATCAFLLPSVLVVCVSIVIGRRRHGLSHGELVGLVVSALAPAASLAFAWDLSRLLIWTMPTATIVLHFAIADRLPARGHVPAEIAPAAGLATRMSWLLVALSTALAGIHFASPFVYAYFDFCTADYTVAPRALAISLPARVGYQFVIAYNRHRMINRRTNIVDRLRVHDDHGVLLAQLEAKDLEVVGRTMAIGANASLAPGDYDVEFQLNVSPACVGGEVRVAAVSLSRWGHDLASAAATVAGSQAATLRVSVDAEASALGPIDLRVYGVSGCTRVVAVFVEPIN